MTSQLLLSLTLLVASSAPLCKARDCSLDQFQCAPGHCISNLWRCDGEPDCTDASDEHECTGTMNCTEPQQFSCASGTACVLALFVCDGDEDCTDGSDELNCNGLDPVGPTPHEAVEATPQEPVEPTSVPTDVTRADPDAAAAAAAGGGAGGGAGDGGGGGGAGGGAGDGGVQNQTLAVPPAEGAGGLSVSMGGAAGPGGERENSASGPDRGWLLMLVASYVALTL